MTKILKIALLAGAMIAAPQMAQAKASSGSVISGIGYVDEDLAVNNSSAVKNAATQAEGYFKPQRDKYQQRATALQSQINAMIEKYKKDAAAAKPDQASLAQQAQAIQAMQQNGQQELNQILVPLRMSQAYVSEQISDQMESAERNAMAARGVSILLKQDATILAAKGYDVTDEVTAQLNKLIPNAQIVPPAGWEPREVREQRAAAAAAQGAAAPAAPAAAPAPATPAPTGR